MTGSRTAFEGWQIAYSPDLGYAKVDPEDRRRRGRGGDGSSRLWVRHVEQVDQIFDSPRDGVVHLVGRLGRPRCCGAIRTSAKGWSIRGFLETAEAGERISARSIRSAADLVRNALGRTMSAFHQRYDLLLTPTMPVPALPAGQDLNDPAHERHWIDWSPFSYPFNMTRQPAASIPCGLTGAGLPIGLQIVGPLYSDDQRPARRPRL